MLTTTVASSLLAWRVQMELLKPIPLSASVVVPAYTPTYPSNLSEHGDSDSGWPTRKNHPYKRATEPLHNDYGKMVCKYEDCKALTFVRKCEWR